MKILVPKDILEGCFKILKRYFIVQEFTSVNKVSKEEKMIYNHIAKLIEDKK